MSVAVTACGGSGTVLPRPAVVSTAPAEAATGIPVDTIISATFNQQMNPSTVNESTFVLSDPESALVPGEVTYDSANFIGMFTPHSPLLPATTYTVGISSGVTNIADKPLPADFTWTFTTAP